MEEQYLTEKHYVVCDKGVTPKQLKVTSQSTTFMSGHKAATEKDTLLDNNFLCVGGMMFAAGAAAGICACIPGPGWIVAAAIAIALIAVAAIGYFKCKAAATSRVWTKQSPVLQIEGKKALLLSSIMMCPAEGGTITPKETFWAAWGSQALTNLGHVANFAFGFLAGRGAGAIAGEGIAAGMAVEAGGMAAVRTGMQTAGRSFLNAARTELVESFTFKGWKNAGTFCKIMRGMGIGGAYYEQYNIWTSDKDTVDKLKDSSVGLILSIFAGKGASLVCFPEGTKVHTDKGLQNIENLYEGDLVLTFNEETLEQEYKRILVKHERYTMNMMALELPTGEVLEVTPEHRFYHNGEWIEAVSLQIGDILHLKNGDYTTIVNIENFPKYQKVYNFDVEGNENYYVTEDGILVHNGYNRKLDDGTYEIGLNYKEGWSPEQIVEANAKVNALNEVGDLMVTAPQRGSTSAAQMYRNAGFDIPDGKDIDHIKDLQFGGLDEVGNMWPLDKSVNRSLGSQIYHQTKNLPDNSIISNIVIE